MPCNSDQLKSIKAYLSNTSDRPLTATVTVRLDGVPVATAKAELGAFSTHQPVKLEQFKPPLDLLAKPIELGLHELTVEAEAPGGGPADRAVLAFSVAPAEVRNVEVKPKDKDTIEITWDANPEEKMPGADISYQILRAGGANAAEVIETVKRGQQRFEAAASEEERKRFRFAVRAVDGRTGLVGQRITLRQIEQSSWEGTWKGTMKVVDPPKGGGAFPAHTDGSEWDCSLWISKVDGKYKVRSLDATHPGELTSETVTIEREIGKTNDIMECAFRDPQRKEYLSKLELRLDGNTLSGRMYVHIEGWVAVVIHTYLVRVYRQP